MEHTIEWTDEFRRWLYGLRDQTVRARILFRIKKASSGNFGDCKPVGDGIAEMRIHFGPGYRVYYGQRGEVTYLLIAGGDKSTQSRDIARAKAEWKAIREQESW